MDHQDQSESYRPDNLSALPSIQQSGRNGRTRILNLSSSSRKCHTCGGSGKIPRDQDDQLVALIPFSDKRLKPRRNWIYVIFVILYLLLTLVLITGSILGVFMFPRDVNIDISNITEINNFIKLKNSYRSKTSNITEYIENITLTIETEVLISNQNYFPVYVHQVNSTISHFNNIVSNYTHIIMNTESISIRNKTKLTITQNATFTPGNSKRLFTTCTSNEWKRWTNIQVQVSVDYEYFSQKSAAVNTIQQFMDCYLSFDIYNMSLARHNA